MQRGSTGTASGSSSRRSWTRSARTPPGAELPDELTYDLWFDDWGAGVQIARPLPEEVIERPASLTRG